MVVAMDQRSNANGDERFDPSAQPPFKIGDIRAAIPKHCWVKSPLRSMSYVARDIFAVVALAVAAVYFDSWFFWPLYWAAQGTLFWAIFVLGHDCGHGSFSDIPLLNTAVGHILHSFILVPYHGWRISHRTHHQNHGHVENDESWVPLPEKLYKNLSHSTRMLRYTVPLPMLAYPLYLWYRSPGKEGSHYNPYSSLFAPSERKLIATSTTCWSIMLATLVYLSFLVGPVTVLKVYGVPYIIFVMWLDAVTYLHGKLRVEPGKLVMTDGEKKKLSQDLEALGEEFPQNIVDLLREQSGSDDQSGEVEIEIEIDTLSDETLFMVRKLLDEHLREKKKSLEKSEPCAMEIVHDSGFSNSPLQPSKCDLLIDEDVDIVGGNDPPVSSHPPFKIEKDAACRNSSSSSSSESGSSSSDSDSCSSSGSETDSIKVSNPTCTEEKKERGVGMKKKEDDNNGEKNVINESLNKLGQVELDVEGKSTTMDAVHALPAEETAPPVRQDSPGKRQRAALLKNRFADTIMKAREKTLTKGENGDPEKLRIEREKFERRLREENARLQAEAKAAEEARRKAEAEAAEKARREREQEREAARQALQKMEKTVEINEGRRFMEDLEMLRATGAEADQLPTFMKEMSPNMLGSFKMEGNSNPLEQLGLYMKMDEDEEDEPHFSQGEVDEQPFDRKERLTLSPHVAEKEDQVDSGNEKPVSEKGQENENQEDEKEGEEQIENVPVNPHGEEGLVNGSEGREEVVSEQAQDNWNQEDEKLINQNEGKEQLENMPEQENGVEDKADEKAEVMDEETQVGDIVEEEAEVVDVDMVKVERN